MLTRIIVRDDELAGLSRMEQLALEYLLHERLSDLARHRRSGDSAVLLAIRAANFLEPMLHELGDAGTESVVEAVRASEIGRAALRRTSDVAALAEAADAA